MDTCEGLEALQTVAPKAPVTYERLVSCQDLGIPKPNVLRAMKAVDAEHPNGTAGHQSDVYSVLQQHVSFFDTDNDGIIFPWETFTGFRALGSGLFISSLAMILCFQLPYSGILDAVAVFTNPHQKYPQRLRGV